MVGLITTTTKKVLKLGQSHGDLYDQHDLQANWVSFVMVVSRGLPVINKAVDVNSIRRKEKLFLH